MNAVPHQDITPDTAAVLDTLPLAIAVVHPDGSLCHANAPARRLASIIHSDPRLGLARLTAAPPRCRHAGACDGSDCEDCLACESEDGKPLMVVRQWRACGTGGLQTVTIRPAHGQGVARTTADTAPDPTLPAANDADLASEMVRTERLATVGQLAAGMAHEINNPICYVQSNLGTFRDYLNKIFGLLELAEDLLRDPDRDRDERLQALAHRKRSIDLDTIMLDLPALLEESREGVERIRHIVQSLRDFSRSEPGQGYQRYDVHRALDAALDIVRCVNGRSLHCTTHFNPVPLIECNPTEMNQLFMNLMVNATHAIDADGHIEIHTRAADPDHVEVVIRDDGCGMDEEVLSHIFEPFFTTKAVGKGTGLGLSIGYGIVKKHAGDIAVQSAPGQGTTFTITLPVKPPRTH